MLNMSANRLHVLNPSLSLLSWLFCSANQTVRRSLKGSAKMKKRTEDILTNDERPRYETLTNKDMCNATAKAPD